MKVGVVGAGIAGLRTAQLLERFGMHVTVFEAKERVGGRLHTLQRGNGYYEAGGEWIDADHDRTISMLREFGLEPEEVDDRPRRLRFCGQDAWSDDAWPESARSLEALWEAVPRVRSGEMRARALSDVLDAVCKDDVSRAYCEAVALSDEGTDSDQVDAQAWADFYKVYEGRSEDNEEMSAYRFPGGGQSLCELIAASLKNPVMTGQVLTDVSKTEDGLRLTFQGGGSYKCFACVLTMPPPSLSRIGLPEANRPWDGIVMSPTCKVVLEFTRPFWEDFGWGGHLMSDLPVQQVWPGGRDGLHLLTCYINGRGVQSIIGDPVQECLQCLEGLFPGVKDIFVGGSVHDWSTDPFTGGGFPVVPPGVGRRNPAHFERIYFAGDWTAQWMGFVEGALESAERAAMEVMNG